MAAFSLILAMIIPAMLGLASPGAESPANCHIGSYRLAGGGTIDIAPSEGANLRWRTFSGSTGMLTEGQNGEWVSTEGWTGRRDGTVVTFSDCADARMTFGGRTGEKIAFESRETTFQSGDATLSGRLVLPAGNGKVPVVVLLHGSEQDSAKEFNALQRMFPAEGVGAFVYDKRGTGSSGGAYTQDVELLSKDAVAAMNEARRLAGQRAGRVGFQGPSEGGWVAPLAANRAHVDFVIVSFGLAVTALEEDQESVALDMALHHRSATESREAMQLTRAGERVIESRGTEGYALFDSLRQKYKSQPWYNDVHGDFVYLVLPLNEEQIHDAATKMDFHTSFDYQPMPTLRASTTPQLWILGADDLDAPSGETAKRIQGLIDDRRPFTLAVFPHAEHGMTEYVSGPNGTRLSTRYAPGYFEMMRDFILYGRIANRYGDATITKPPDLR